MTYIHSNYVVDSCKRSVGEVSELMDCINIVCLVCVI